MSRVCIIGLDCLTPQLVFDQFLDQLPTFKRLMAQGSWGKLRSIDPPITVPAWACMMTGQSPGALGIYGFRDRKKYDYSSKRIASSLSVQAPTLWEVASRAGLESCVLGVPLTYPAKPFKGHMITGCMTPDDTSAACYPPNLLKDIEPHFGKFHFDIEDFRYRDKSTLLEDLYQLSNQRFDIAKAWLQEKPWDLFVMVDMAPDRLHHIFWGDMVDADEHTKTIICDFYRHLDKKLNELTAHLREDDTLLIVSDHGAQTMEGGFAINRWLEQEGYLKLKHPVAPGTKLSEDMVDWGQTQVWGAGGYVGRLFFNIRGREPCGTVSPDELPDLKDEVYAKLKALKKLDGNPLPIQVLEPDTTWENPRGMPPDAMLYLDDLSYRVLGTLGWENPIQRENDLGRDGANHQHDGIIIQAGGLIPPEGRNNQLLIDVFSNVLGWLGIKR